MKMLKRLFLFSWRRREDRPQASLPSSLIDRDEFARLISSGRVEDLQTLALKLSAQSKAHA